LGLFSVPFKGDQRVVTVVFTLLLGEGKHRDYLERPG
jgi:hypothetical protein